MAKNVTIYVRDEAMYKRAKTLAKREGISLSSLISRELARWIEKRQSHKISLPAGDITIHHADGSYTVIP